jgi:hypothetical protein
MTMMSMTGDTATRRTSFWSVMAAHIAELCAGAREGRAIEARYDELCRKSSAELAEMGMTRYEIAHAALIGPHC